MNSSLVPRLGPRGVRSYLREDLLFGKSFSRCQPAAGRTKLTSLSVTSLSSSSSSSFFHLLLFAARLLRLFVYPPFLLHASLSLCSQKYSLFKFSSADPVLAYRPYRSRPRFSTKQRREREREIEGKKDDYQHCSVSLSAQFNRLRLNEANCLIHRDYSESSYLQECSAKLT